MVDERLQRFIDPGVYTYDFTKGPHVIRSDQEARERGNNCVTLAHLAMYSLFNRVLDRRLGCYELFSDLERFAIVPALDDMQKGDLVFFGITHPKVPIEEFSPQYDDKGQLLNWRDSPLRHVSVYTGEHDDRDDPLLLHSTHFAGTNVIWPLSKFAKYPRYKEIYRISRLQATSLTE